MSETFSYALFRNRQPQNLVVLIVKKTHNMLAMEAKNAENPTRSEFSFHGQKFWRQCVSVIDTT